MAGRDFSAELFGPSAGRDFSAELFGAKPSEKESFFRQVVDVPLGIAKGAVQGVRMIADAFGAGSDTSKTIKSAETYLADLMSAQAKNDQQEISRIMKDAEDKGVLDQVKAAVKAFSVAPVDTLSSALGTAAPVIVGALGAKVLGAGALVSTGVSALTGAGMGAGTIKGSIYEETKRTLKDAGASEEEAERRAQLAQQYNGKNLDQILLGTVLGGAAAVGPLEKGGAAILARRILGKTGVEATESVAEKTAKGALRRRAEAGLLEAVPEAVQAGQEQVAQNIALQREGFNVPTFRGAAGAATLEALAGFGLGTTIGGGKPEVAKAPEPAPAPTPPAPPVGALEYKPEPYIQFPDGTVAKRSEVEAYIKTLPEDQQMAMRAKLLGLAPQEAEKEPAPTAKALEYKPEPLIVYPDGSVAKRSEVDAYIQGLPEDQQIPARAKLLGMGEEATQVTPEMLRKLGIRGRAPIIQRLTGLELTDPKVAEELTNFAQQSFASPEVRGNIFGFLNTLKTLETQAPKAEIPPAPPAPPIEPPAAPPVEPPKVEAPTPPAQPPSAPKVEAAAPPAFESKIVSRQPAPDGMEVHVFTTTDGYGTGLFDADAGQYVNGSVTRFAGADTLPKAEARAAEMLRKATPAAPAEPSVEPLGTRKEAQAFGKAIGATQPYPGELRGRVNLPAQKAAKEGNFQGVLSALEKSKNVIVAEIAKRARALGTKIVIDDDAEETYTGPSTLMRQMSIDGAKMHLEALNKIRALAPQVDALPDKAELSYAIRGETINAIDGGESAGRMYLEDIAKMGHSMFAPLPIGESKFKTKEDFKRLQKAYEDLTSEYGENALQLTSTGSAQMTGVAGVYDADTDTIRVPEYNSRREDVLAHEIVHAQTVQAIANPSLRQKPIVARLNKLYEHVKKELEVRPGFSNSLRRAPYGIQSIQEFVAEGMGNPAFQFLLKKIKYENTSAWDSFVQTIANLIGVKRDTAFTELLSIYSELTTEQKAETKVEPSAPAAAATAAPTPFMQRLQEYWGGTVTPAIRNYLDAFNSFGVDRLEKSQIKPAGMTAREWIESFVSKQSTWDKGRKTGETGIQALSTKNLWPTTDGSGERLRKAMLDAVKALKNAPGSTSVLVDQAFGESKPTTIAAPKAEAPAVEATAPKAAVTVKPAVETAPPKAEAPAAPAAPKQPAFVYRTVKGDQTQMRMFTEEETIEFNNISGQPQLVIRGKNIAGTEDDVVVVYHNNIDRRSNVYDAKDLQKLLDVDPQVVKAIQKWLASDASTITSNGQELAKTLSDFVEGSAAETPAAPKAEAPPTLDTTGIKEVKGRHPQVQAAAQLLQDKKMTREEFEKYVDYYKPIQEVEAEKLLPPTSEQRMNETVNADKRDKINVPVADGTKVGLRMDLPARERGGSVVSIHEGKPGKLTVGKLMGFRSTGWLKDVTFEVRSQEKGLAVATGAAKAPQQTVEGTWFNLGPEETYARVKELMKDPAWTQVGFDPSRHGYFYDRKTREPVVSASEMYQVGQFLLAKDVKYAPKTDFLYSLGKEQTRQLQDFQQTLRNLLNKFGLKDVGLNIEEGMRDAGSYSQQLIRIASDEANPIRTLRHEAIHALRELGFFTDAQWNSLSKMAKDKWIDQYLKQRNEQGRPLKAGEESRYDAYMREYNGDMEKITEEAVADAFADFDATKPPAGMLQALLKRMRDLFQSIKSALTKIESPEQIFGKVEKGELKADEKREAGERKSLGKVTAAAQKALQKQPMPEKGLSHVSKDLTNLAQPIFFPQNKTILDRIDSMKDRFWQRLAQKTADQFRTIKEYSPLGYMQARLSKSVDGSLEGLLFHGQVFDDGGALNIKKNTKGMMDILKPIGNELDSYLMWVALNRESRLPEDKRSKIPNMDKLVARRAEFAAGELNGKPRVEVYQDVLRQMNQLNKSVLDIALAKGLIDQAGYDKFSNDIYYIPFYKKMEEDGTIEGAQTASGLTSQYFSKELKGGEAPFGDLMENIVRNWSHILSASMKNAAAKTTIDDAMKLQAAEPNLKAGLEMRDGVVYSTKSDKPIEAKFDEDGKQLYAEGELRPDLTTSGTGMAKIMVNGQPMYFKVTDDLLMDSISSIGYMGPKSKFLDVMRDFKNMLQYGVTASPIFKVNNLIRDSVSALAVSDLKKSPVYNVMTGISLSKKDSPTYISALAGGAIFNFGSAYEGDQAKLIKRLIDQGVDGDAILDSKEKITKALKKTWDAYQHLGDRSEAANRLALYQQLRDKGMSHLEASFMARDLLDFSMQGSWPAFRLITQVVPFMNARIQGLYKLGRDGINPTVRVLYNATTGKEIDANDKIRAAQFATVTSAVMLASALLYLSFKDDEDFKKRDAWDRDNFWWFKIPSLDIAFRVPKPFEVGAFGTLVERSLEQILDQGAEGKTFADSLKRTLWDTFALNPTPQMFKPLFDLYANKDSFSGAPIESAGLERLSKQERVTEQTSPLAIALSKVWSTVMPEKVESSPVQVDYAIKGYFGWLGAMASMASTYAVMPFKEGEYPDARWLDRASLGLVRDLPAPQSAYVTAFYENAKEISQAYADMRHYREIGDAEKVQELLEEKGDKIALAKFYDKTSKNIANVRKQIQFITNDKTLDGATKKEEIERMKLIMSDLAKQAEEVRKSMKP